jgi:hypothetical protein
MKGDFARVTYDRTRHYSQVFQQQGRVLLEADWNEQGALMLHLLRSLAFDLMGPCWAAGSGFKLDTSDPKKPNTIAPAKDWRLSRGHFYVDGILCENDTLHTLAEQPYAPTPDYNVVDGSSGFENIDGAYALWLDVWERHLSAIEAPRIKDPALNGVDTASRAQVVWQVRAWTEETAKAWLQDVSKAIKTRHDAADPASPEFERTDKLLTVIEKLLKTDLHLAFGKLGGNPPAANVAADDSCEELRWCLDARRRYAIPQLRAQVKPAESDEDPCVIAADARYRGCENQLYRVEIHDRGLPGAGATFKWSRENGSVIYSILDHGEPGEPAKDGSAQMSVELADLGRDDRLGLRVDDWVELLDDDCTLQQHANALLQVAAVDIARRTVTLTVPKNVTPYLPSKDSGKHPLLRRWDQRDDVSVRGLVDVVEGKAIALECGIQIAFEAGGLYATGDYWVIPARVAGNGSLDWPLDPNAPGPDFAGVARNASGVHHVSVLGGVDAQDVYRECCCRHVPDCVEHAVAFDPILDALAPANKPAMKAPAKPKPKGGAAKKRGGH